MYETVYHVREMSCLSLVHTYVHMCIFVWIIIEISIRNHKYMCTYIINTSNTHTHTHSDTRIYMYVT